MYRPEKSIISGATGYVAGWLIKRLLEDGHHVHAAVRDPSNEQKLAHLNALQSERSLWQRFPLSQRDCPKVVNLADRPNDRQDALSQGARS
ncbi:MAG: NAD(P)H-binding protein [Leptolyngbyaceae cyanobacterium RM2_2_4]|nr:NAD(P)H-binding protein [Leptolyngbyaceae cyanobacterium RM2_2_4]